MSPALEGISEMPDETLELYDGFSAVLDVHELRLCGDAVLRLMNGSLVLYRRPPLNDYREHWESSPEHLKACIRMIKEAYGYPADSENLMAKLCDDVRMKEFWDWFVSVKFQRMQDAHSSFCIFKKIEECLVLPGKPGNLPPGKRNAYFEKVRKHVNALSELLRDTKFDNPQGESLSEHELDKKLRDVLQNWGEEDGRIFAFHVDKEGPKKFHISYPQSDLTKTLAAVLEWTYWDDLWYDGIYGTSAPIAQANTESTEAIYFNCTLYDWFKLHGVAIPFPVLATVANVALDLPLEKSIDEDTARKQVRRYQARQAKRDGSEGTDTGQNFTNWDDSVLSDQF